MSDYEGEQEEKKMDFDWMPSGASPLADGEYDVIVMGTGLTECIVSGLLSTQGKRVLHVDRNNYYGADTASLSLTNLYQKFRGSQQPPASLGANRDWNVDLVPKFIMSCGNLVKILLHSKVTRYLEFRSVGGSYVYKDNKVQKVPATPAEALSSSLMGFFEKRKFRNFLMFVDSYDPANKATYFDKSRSCDQVTTKELFEYYNLDSATMNFTGHAMALHTDDSYLQQPATATVDAIKLYAYSLERYSQSPYLYPLYGLGGIPEGFSRLCAIHHGTFMLNLPVQEVLFDENGVAWGIRSADNQVAKAPIIIGDPSYFPSEKTRVAGRVVRSICILDHPISNTDNASSVQIIIPAREVKRNHDIYVAMVGAAHNVAANGKYIAIASTTVETADPIKELDAAFNLMGTILERFDDVSDIRVPVSDGTTDNCYISESYDATSHFETAANDVLNMYKRITGTELDMTISADITEE